MKINITILLFIFFGCQSHYSLSDTKYEPGFEVFSQIKSNNNTEIFSFYLHKIDSSKITINTMVDTTVAINSIITIPKTKKIYPKSSGYEFLINKPGKLEIDFYSFCDSFITNIYSGILEKGIYELDFDKIQIKAGSYILKLKFNNEQISKKLLLSP